MNDVPTPARIESLLAHGDWVRRVARVLSSDAAAAADLEQDLWVGVLENPPRPRTSIRGWLAAALRRDHLDRRKADARRRGREEAAARPEASGSTADLVAEADAQRRVVQAVLELEEPYRTTVLLRWFEDLKPVAIAARQGIPVDTVRTRLRRAIERLRERLSRELGGEGRALAVVLAPLARFSRGDGIAAPVTAGLVGGGLLMSKTAAAGALLVLGLGLAFLLRPDGGPGGSAGNTVVASDREGAPAIVPARGAPPVVPSTAGGDSGTGTGREPPAPPPPVLPDMGPTRRRVLRDIATGEPLPGFRVRVSFNDATTRKAAEVERTSDESGALEIPDGGLRAVEPAGAAWMLLSEARTAQEDLWFSRAEEVHGSVRRADDGALGEGETSLQVILGFANPDSMTAAPADPWNFNWAARNRVPRFLPGQEPAVDGSFRIRVPVVPGVALRATHPGWSPAYSLLPYGSPGSSSPVELRFEREMIRISLDVRDGDGLPLRNTRVEAYITNRMPPGETQGFLARYGTGAYSVISGAREASVQFAESGRTGEDGTLRLSSPIPGDVTVVVTGVPGHAVFSRRLGPADALAAGVRLDIVRLDPNDRVLLTLAGAPLPALPLTILSAPRGRDAQWSFRVDTDDEGRAPAGHFKEGETYVFLFPGGVQREVPWSRRQSVVEFADIEGGVSLRETLRAWKEGGGDKPGGSTRAGGRGGAGRAGSTEGPR